jgi:hypothetical protein
MWETITGGAVRFTMWDDSEGAIKIIANGKSVALRHLSRTHRVSVAWLHEQLSPSRVPPPLISLRHVGTAEQRADIFTKPFTDAVKWTLASVSIGVVDPASASVQQVRDAGSAPDVAKASPSVALSKFREDFWDFDGTTWTRIHRVPRKLAFQPSEGPEGPTLSALGDVRVTHRLHIDGTLSEQTDRWRDVVVPPCSEVLWVGRTMFPLLVFPLRAGRGSRSGGILSTRAGCC